MTESSSRSRPGPARRSPARAPFALALRDGDELVELNRRGHYLLLSDDGLFLGSRREPQGAVFVAWESVTHLAHGKRSLWIGTQSTVRIATRGRRTPVDLGDVSRRIEARIARRPGGLEQLVRMREVDARARRARPPRVALAFVVACVAVHLLQVRDSFVSDVGIFSSGMVGQGELWRLVTPHFLHDPTWFYVPTSSVSWWNWMFTLPVHITFNSVMALLLGTLVELSLGRARTIFVLAVSGIGALTFSAAGSTDEVLGASGLAFGLAGAVLALEVSVPDRLPASWRLPRGLLLAAVGLDMLFGFAMPWIAGWAHLGGFVAGYLATRPLARGLVRGSDRSAWLRPAAAAVGVTVAVAFAAAGALVLRSPWAFERHARNVLALEDVAPVRMNDLAWRIATESADMQSAGESALELAERAVERTERGNPDFLDTLAEVHFQLGDPEAALVAIEEAIEIAPWDDYFHEQRDRFIGLRDAGDRPEPAPGPWHQRIPREPAPWDDGTGIDV